MQTKTFKSISESALRVMLGEVNEAIDYKNLIPGSMVKIKDYAENWVVVSANNDKVRVFSVYDYPEDRKVVTFPTKNIVKVLAKKYNMDEAAEVYEAIDYKNQRQHMQTEASINLQERSVNWLLGDYKTNPLHAKAVPFFDAANPLKYPYIILTEASEDGRAIPLLFMAKEDAEAYKNQKEKEGVKFTVPFKLTMA